MSNNTEMASDETHIKRLFVDRSTTNIRTSIQFYEPLLDFILYLHKIRSVLNSYWRVYLLLKYTVTYSVMSVKI